MPRRTEIPTREVAAALKSLLYALKPVIGWGALASLMLTVLFAMAVFNSDHSTAYRICSGVLSVCWAFFTLRAVLTWQAVNKTLAVAIRKEASLP